MKNTISTNASRTSRTVKTRIIGIGIVIAALMTLILAGCSQPSPTQTADTFLKGLQSGDPSDIQKVYDGDTGLEKMLTDAEKAEEASDPDANDDQAVQDFDAESIKSIEEKLKGFEYSISNEKIDGDKATVDVSIKTYNLGNAFSQFFTNYMTQGLALAFSGGTEEQMKDLATKLLTNAIDGASKDYEKTVPLAMSKSDGKWVIDSMDDQQDFVNAITGGLLDAANTITSAFGGDSSN